jgi:hypothetical protein
VSYLATSRIQIALTNYLFTHPCVLIFRFTVAVAPGHTATALNNYQGTQTVEVGAQYITDAILDRSGPSGVFVQRDKVHPW